MGKRDKRKLKGTSTKPRLSVYRSNNHIYAQAIDDLSSITILSCSTLEVDIKTKCEGTSPKYTSKLVGELIGRRLLAKNIQEIVFDRGGKPYHGRIKELAEGVRFVGIVF